MTTNLKASLESMVGGLFLMTIFTTAWIGLAEYNLGGRDYGVFGIVFLPIVLIFVINYFKFSNAAKTVTGISPLEKSAEEKKKDKWFMIIGALEGVAIFLTANVLINIKLYNYFVPAVALIVGLHFFPLGYTFKKPFHYFVGTWTCIVALVGIILTYQHVTGFEVIAIVGIGCAIATTLQGVRMIMMGRKVMRQTSLSTPELKHPSL